METPTRVLAVAALLSAAAVPLAGGPPARAGTTEPVVLVANSEQGTVQFLDAREHEVRRTVDVLPEGPPDPAGGPPSDPARTANALLVNAFAGDNFVQDLDLSPDGRTLYVSRGHAADVAAFDLTADPARMLWNTSVDGFRADHMTIAPDGDRLFVSDLTEYQVLALATADGSREGSFPTGQYAHGVNVVSTADPPSALSPENARAPGGDCAFRDAGARLDRCVYSASIGDIVLFPRELRAHQPGAANPVLSEPYRLTIADADTLEVARTLTFPDGIRPAAFALSGQAPVMYYQESEFRGLVEYDLREGEERRRVQLRLDENVSGEDYAFEAPHHGLALSPDGSTLCSAARAADDVALVSTDTLLATHVVEDVGDAPGWAATGPTGEACWVANTGSEAGDGQPPADTVAVVGYADGRLRATIDTDAGPKHLLPAEVPSSVLGG